MEEYYRSFPDYCRENFGRRLYRAALDAGMTCPNRDGTCGERGCLFCSAGGSGEFAVSYHGQKLTQEDLIYNHRKASPGDYIAYFQSYTNTYAPAGRLRFLFGSALEDPLFAGISVATRPDCVGEEVLDVLKDLKEKYPGKFIWIELGLQTMHEDTARLIRRGYTLDVFDSCVSRIHEAGIPVIVHIIAGLPGETPEHVYQTIRHLNDVRIEGIKIQLLHYLKDADLGQMYLAQPDRFHPLSEEEYIDIVTECIALLDPSVVIHRLTGDGEGSALIAPLWSRRKLHVLNEIRHQLKVRQIRQGCKKEDDDVKNG
jgi:radical SAM protein (TIGR01212 family)